MAELLPPWLEHPHIPLGSIGWRMGYGEEYWFKFRDWFASLESSGRAQVRERYPEPEGWDGFYARLRGRE